MICAECAHRAAALPAETCRRCQAAVARDIERFRAASRARLDRYRDPWRDESWARPVHCNAVTPLSYVTQARRYAKNRGFASRICGTARAISDTMSEITVTETGGRIASYTDAYGCSWPRPARKAGEDVGAYLDRLHTWKQAITDAANAAFDAGFRAAMRGAK